MYIDETSGRDTFNELGRLLDAIRNMNGELKELRKQAEQLKGERPNMRPRDWEEMNAYLHRLEKILFNQSALTEALIQTLQYHL